MAAAVAPAPLGRLVGGFSQRDRRLRRRRPLARPFQPACRTAWPRRLAARLGGQRGGKLCRVGRWPAARRGVRGLPAQLPRSRRHIRVESRAVPFVPDRRGRWRVGRDSVAVSGQAHFRGRPLARRQFRSARRRARARRRNPADEGRGRVPGASTVEHDARARGRLLRVSRILPAACSRRPRVSRSSTISAISSGFER
jgi:hypothetical protein